MKLLVFEYSSVCSDSSLITEGFYMLKALLSDLEHISFFDTYFLINEKFDNLNFNNCISIYPNENFFEWLKNNCHNFEYCLFIAPEDDLIQYRITKILEENRVKNIGSTSKASYICSSKYLTYKSVSNDVLKIKTLKINVDNINFHDIEKLNNNLDLIVKPDNKTSSELIYHIHNEEELKNVLEIYEEHNVNDILVQEYVQGEAVSVSVLCNEDYVNCISINSQIIKTDKNNMEYMGCETPIEHRCKNKLYEMSSDIIKSIGGLKGFVGIDYIINYDEIYFVEVNARITTPFIVLQEKCNENLTKCIIHSIKNKKSKKITFKNKGKFNKKMII